MDITHVFIVLQPGDVFDSIYGSWEELVKSIYLGEYTADDWKGWKVIDEAICGGCILGWDEMALGYAILYYKDIYQIW